MKIWMYREAFKVKHLFNDIFAYRAACGAGRSSYYTYKWHYDEKGLTERKACKNCTKISEDSPISGPVASGG